MKAMVALVQGYEEGSYFAVSDTIIFAE